MEIKKKFFKGCEDCRDCCNGKLFSLGEVTISDFRNIIKLFPTSIDIKNRKIVFFYSLVPMIGCFYLRDSDCSIYNIIERPNTCLNYPFGLTKESIEFDVSCPNLVDEKSEKTLSTQLSDGSINPDIFNNFFTEEQYNAVMIDKDKILDKFINYLIDNNLLVPIPKIKTKSGKIVNIKEIDDNKNMYIINTKKFKEATNFNDNQIFYQFLEWHILSMDHFQLFADRMLDKLS